MSGTEDVAVDKFITLSRTKNINNVSLNVSRCIKDYKEKGSRGCGGRVLFSGRIGKALLIKDNI